MAAYCFPAKRKTFVVPGFLEPSLRGSGKSNKRLIITAKLMGLPYPGGAALAGLADQCPQVDVQNLLPFPRPMTDRPGLDFSFSGLKTHVLTTWSNSNKSDEARRAIAKAFQDAVVDTLLIKCRRALKQTGNRRLVVAGGGQIKRCVSHLIS